MKIEEGLITRVELARRLGKSISTIHVYIQSGRYKQSEGRILVDEQVKTDLLAPPADGRKRKWKREPV